MADTAFEDPKYYFSALDEPTQQAMRLKLIALDELDFVRSQQKYKLAREQLERAATGGSPYAIYLLVMSYWYGGWGQYYDPVRAYIYVEQIKDPLARKMVESPRDAFTQEIAQTAFKNGNFIPMEILTTNFRLMRVHPEMHVLRKLGSATAFHQLRVYRDYDSELVYGQVNGMERSCMSLFALGDPRNLIKLREMLLYVDRNHAEERFDALFDKTLNIEKSTLDSQFDRLISMFCQAPITLYFIGSDPNEQRRHEHERKFDVANTRRLFEEYKKQIQSPIIAWLCCAKRLYICKDNAVAIAKLVFATRYDIMF